MGGCASRPKGFKAEFANSGKPVPAADPEKEELCTASEEKTVVEEAARTAEAAQEEKVENAEVDEQSNKHRSLSSLFNEKRGKDSTESGEATQTENVPSEPVKGKDQNMEKTVKETVVNVVDAEKAKSPAEEKATPAVVASETVQTEKPSESAPAEAVKTEKPEKSDEKKTKKENKEGPDKDVKLTEKPSGENIRPQEPVPLESPADVVSA
ncbi:PREDICTED: patellin-1-like isoform X1 [Nelumbo nucifera]|uniref:Patellin-1-like isoform X1 n=1 Tax=Nelumbo nucifera TaxID=4432 RepID=A0A1U8A7B4_NELNU|nr:PREDICTED: patellin-1-like isoform X1 [Nelumbo nucifera]